MKDGNIVQEKSYALALRMVRIYHHLRQQREEFVLSKQVLRSGTSIGANVEESIGAQSGRDFVARMSIAYKEARETHYWLRLLRDAGYLEETESASIIADCEELLRLTASICKN